MPHHGCQEVSYFDYTPGTLANDQENVICNLNAEDMVVAASWHLTLMAQCRPTLVRSRVGAEADDVRPANECPGYFPVAQCSGLPGYFRQDMLCSGALVIRLQTGFIPR